ncbi:MAG: VWA domain-containing protein [Anaerolineae bacterium]|nr:VWA domain-containing protein [Anaerolineae bacterium]
MLGDTAQAREPVEPLHIVLLVDDSNSMAENDPDNLRLVAAKLFISLLEPQDQAAVIRFSTDSQVVVPFTKMVPEVKRDLMAQLDRGFSSEGMTDIRAALAQAGTLMATAPAGKGRVVFLTDGMPYIPAWQSHKPTTAELTDYVEETLELAEEIGQPVLTVALGAQVDQILLQAISQATQGRYFAAATALALPAIYLELLSELQDRVIVGPGQLAAPSETTVDVHPYAQSVGFVIVKDPAVTPSIYPQGILSTHYRLAPRSIAGHNQCIAWGRATALYRPHSTIHALSRRFFEALSHKLADMKAIPAIETLRLKDYQVNDAIAQVRLTR